MYYSHANTYGNEVELYKRIVEDYTTAMECGMGANADVHYNLACVHAKMGKFGRAIGEYTKTIELDNNYADAYYNRGNVYWDLRMAEGTIDNSMVKKAIEDIKKAIEIYRKVINDNPDLTWARETLAKAELKLKTFTER
jgi:tetratricopeptide (TPR) repeat protein